MTKKKLLASIKKLLASILILVFILLTFAIFAPLAFLAQDNIDQKIKIFAKLSEYFEILVDFLKTLAWPVSVVIILFYYKNEIIQLLQGSQETVIKIPGAEFKVRAKEVTDALTDIFSEIDTILKSHLTQEQKNLFLRILSVPTSPKVEDIYPGFVRETHKHKMLRALRGVYFIRPVEGKQWEANKHIEVTNLGRIVARHKRDALMQKISSDG